METHLPLPAEDVQLLRPEGLALSNAVSDLGDRNWGVDGADVDKGAPLLAVQVVHPCHRTCAVELQDKCNILVQAEETVFIDAFPERGSLPVLPLVLSEVENLEWFAPGYAQ